LSQLHNVLQYPTDLLVGIGRFLGISEQEEGVSRVSETFQPVFDPWSIPEVAFLRNELLVAGAQSQAAVAAQLSFIALQNPPLSNLLVVVDEITARNITAADVVQIGFATAAQVTANGGVVDAADSIPRDTRWTARNAGYLGRCTMITGTAAGVLGNVFENLVSETTDLVRAVSVPLVLSPGFAVVVKNSTVNAGLGVNFKWRERRVIPRELP
jgi:hypothetical protein